MTYYLLLIFLLYACFFRQSLCEEGNPLLPLYEAQTLCNPECHNLVQAQVVAELSLRFVTNKTGSRCNKLSKDKCLQEAEASQSQLWESTESDCKWLEDSEYFLNKERGICSVKSLTIPIVLQTTKVILESFSKISENYKQNPLTLTASCFDRKGGEEDCKTIENCTWCPFTSFFTTPNSGKGLCVPDDEKQQKEPGLSYCSLVNAGNSNSKSPFSLGYPYSLVQSFFKSSDMSVQKKLLPHVLSFETLIKEEEDEETTLVSDSNVTKFKRNLPLDDPKAEPDSVSDIERVIDSLFDV